MNYETKRIRTIMIFPLTYIVVLLLLRTSYAEHQESMEMHFSKFIADLWLEGADIIKIIWRDCSKKLVDVRDVIDHKEYFPKFVRCMKRKTLRALDRSLTPDVVPIMEGVSLVRFELIDPSGIVVPENDTSTWSEKEFDESDWRTLALQRMANVLRTHVIKFDFKANNGTLDKAEFRSRRRHHMLTMMMFGIVSIGMVFIPMGFQFLAVLGGKAMLLAKMALILASIQGLKKIATSPVNYGFYHSYLPPYDHYQKRSQDDWSPQAIPSKSHLAYAPHISRDTGRIKLDRVHKSDNKNIEKDDLKEEDINPGIKGNDDPEFQRLFPVYLGIPEPSGTIEAPFPLVDSTTNPIDVQADVAMDLPYNGFRFQSPSTVVST